MGEFEEHFGQCPMYYTISQMGGKWKWVILWHISQAGVIRYNKLKNELEPIAHKTLSLQLKELEAGNLIHREQYNEVPPHVEYSMTEKGSTLLPILELMYQWGKKHME
jgi:DNA-binding HxlR family transcriptional regulator